MLRPSAGTKENPHKIYCADNVKASKSLGSNFPSPPRMHFSISRDTFTHSAKLQFPQRQEKEGANFFAKTSSEAHVYIYKFLHGRDARRCRHVIEDKITPKCAAVEINWYSSAQIESSVYAARRWKGSQYADANFIFSAQAAPQYMQMCRGRPEQCVCVKGVRAAAIDAHTRS